LAELFAIQARTCSGVLKPRPRNAYNILIYFVKKDEKMPTLKSILQVLAAFSYSVMILNVDAFGQVSFFVSITVVEHMFDDCD
jgi:hypothetical protein